MIEHYIAVRIKKVLDLNALCVCGGARGEKERGVVDRDTKRIKNTVGKFNIF